MCIDLQHRQSAIRPKRSSPSIRVDELHRPLHTLTSIKVGSQPSRSTRSFVSILLHAGFLKCLARQFGAINITRKTNPIGRMWLTLSENPMAWAAEKKWYKINGTPSVL